MNMLLLVMSSEPVEGLSSKPCPLSTGVFGLQRAEGARGETCLSGCDTGCDSSAVNLGVNNVLLDYKKGFSDRIFIQLCNCRFRYESNHLLDMSADEDNELPSVKSLFEVTNTHIHTNLIFMKFIVEENMFMCFLTFVVFVFPGCLGRGGAEFSGTGPDSLQSPAAPGPVAGP